MSQLSRRSFVYGVGGAIAGATIAGAAIAGGPALASTRSGGGPVHLPGAPRPSRNTAPTQYPASWNVKRIPMQPIPPDYQFGYRVSTIPRGTRFGANSLVVPCDILWERDVPVTLRDGAVIYVDVLRPPGTAKVPTIVASSPYGKAIPSGPAPTVPAEWVSGYNKFEGPDAAFWVNQGYAIVNVDERGIYKSGGGAGNGFGMVNAGDGYDVVEWAGQQKWSTGHVGMNGASWLSMTQWWTAALHPPHLKAIAPWNGMGDIYRNLISRGGIPDTTFVTALSSTLVGEHTFEDMASMIKDHPLMNDYWADKRARVEDITVPAYVYADMLSGFHTAGALDVFHRLGSEEKWLAVNNTNEWYNLYTPQNERDLLKFFDRYLKGKNNGWEKTPRVRVAVTDRGKGGKDSLSVPYKSWPVPQTQYEKLYLDATAKSLSSVRPGAMATTSYAATTGEAVFTIKLGRDTRFVGHPSARIYVEAVGANDLDLFVIVEKLDSDGTPVGSPPQVTEYVPPGPAGPEGRLRASMRALDPAKSSSFLPVHSFDRVERLAAGQVVALDIAMMPIGIDVHAGQFLRFTVAGRFVGGALQPVTINAGTHVVHTGGQHASYLRLPVVPIH